MKPVFPKNSIKKLQNYISKKGSQRGFDDETKEERLLLLVEEIGEVMKAYRKTSGMHTDTNKSDKDSHLGEELADVITMLFWTATGLGIDLEKEYAAKEKINDSRTWKRSPKA